jgi:hypothetical protein
MLFRAIALAVAVVVGVHVNVQADPARPAVAHGLDASMAQSVTAGVAVAAMIDQADCVDCFSELCVQWYHWAAHGPGINANQGAHSNCLANYPNDPIACDGHLLCGGGLSLESQDRANALATAAIRGDPESLREFALSYPDRVRKNSSWGVL